MIYAININILNYFSTEEPRGLPPSSDHSGLHLIEEPGTSVSQIIECAILDNSSTVFDFVIQTYDSLILLYISD